jgi:hypothetical protein
VPGARLEDGFEVAVEAVDVAMAAGDRDPGSGGDDGRSRERAVVDRVAQRQDGARFGAEVTDRREAGQQSLPGVVDRGIGFVLIIAERLLKPGLNAVVQPDQVYVHVDEARHDGAAGKVDHARAGNLDETVPHLRDPPAADDHARLAPRRLSRDRDQGAGMNHRRRFRSGRSGGGLRHGGRGEGESDCGQTGSNGHAASPG